MKAVQLIMQEHIKADINTIISRAVLLNPDVEVMSCASLISQHHDCRKIYKEAERPHSSDRSQLSPRV